MNQPRLEARPAGRMAERDLPAASLDAVCHRHDRGAAEAAASRGDDGAVRLVDVDDVVGSAAACRRSGRPPHQELKSETPQPRPQRRRHVVGRQVGDLVTLGGEPVVNGANQPAHAPRARRADEMRDKDPHQFARRGASPRRTPHRRRSRGPRAPRRSGGCAPLARFIIERRQARGGGAARRHLRGSSAARPRGDYRLHP